MQSGLADGKVVFFGQLFSSFFSDHIKALRKLQENVLFSHLNIIEDLNIQVWEGSCVVVSPDPSLSDRRRWGDGRERG